MTLALTGGLVAQRDGSFVRANVEVDGGRITAVGGTAPPPGDEIVEAGRRLVLPGLVNAHTHSNEAWLRGRYDNLPLDVWLLFAYPLLHAPPQSPREIYVRTALGAMEAVRTGTTAVVDFLYELAGLTEESLAAVTRAYRDVGVRALVCLGVADRSFYETAAVEHGLLDAGAREALDRLRPPAPGEWLELVRTLVARFHRPEEGISIGLAPAGPHRCTDELIAACGALAAELDLQVHTHTLEIARHERHDPGTIEHLADTGFLGPRVHLCHGVWLRDGDPERIAASGASVVHNPLSNLKLGSGRAPVPDLLRAGVHVSLGTDGVCSADGQDMFQAMRTAAVVHKDPHVPYEEWLGAREAWHMATAAGARPFGDPALGAVAPGARADLVLADLDHGGFTPLGDPVHHLGLGAPTAAIRDVLVGGRWVLRNRELVGVDERALLAEAQETAAAVLARHDRAFAFAERLLPGVAAGWHRLLGAAT